MSRTPSKARNQKISLFAVQCGKCFKWRLVPTQEEYETIRQDFMEDPWFCEKKENLSCDDPADLEYDTSRFWVIDKPSIPKTPPGLERHLVMRGDYSKMDVHYIMPTGRRVRCRGEMEKFLDANPKFKGRISSSDLNFTVPKILEDMQNLVKASGSGGKRTKKRKAEEDE